jgi:enterochelin esterase-like enzyme
MRTIRAVSAALLIALALAGCGGGSSTPANSDAAPTLLRASIQSRQTGMTYGYYVYLPPHYDKTQKTYPVIYATDSEYRWTSLSSALQVTQTEAILVNIDATSSARRWVDFTMPGAAAYFRFLTQELIPAVEAQYRIDPTQRMFSGHSLSGEFAMYALYQDDPAHRVFSSILSEDGSFWCQSDLTCPTSAPLATSMEQQMYDASHALPIRLVLAGDATGNGPRVTALFDFFAARGYQGLKLKNLNYAVGHVAMDEPAFIDALAFIFANP